MKKLVEAGFDGCQASPELAPTVRSFGLRFMSSARANTADDVESKVRNAAEAGADALTLHLGWGREDDNSIDHMIDTVLAASVKWKLPVLPETHRATAFQDVWRTLQAVRRRPELRFNGDFSHFYCGQEWLYEGFDPVLNAIQPILERCSCLYGRISSSQSMQVDVGDGRTHPHAQNFKKLWTAVFRAWKSRAGAGALFPFVPELGPPSSGYSLTLPDGNGGLYEVSDRWQQSLVLKRLAEEAFVDAT
jgi:hypothetical protein